MPSKFARLAQKKLPLQPQKTHVLSTLPISIHNGIITTNSLTHQEIITLALGLLITHQNASLFLNVTRKLTWPSSKNGTIFAPTAIQRNKFNQDADVSIVRLGIEAGLWADSSEAGEIGIKTIEEYIMREEKKLVQERLRATSSMLNGIAERLQKCAIDDFGQGFGSAGLGEPWRGAEDELKNALRAVQDYRKVEKSVRVDRDTGFLERDVAGVQLKVAKCTWHGEGRAWGMGNHSHCDEEYNGTWEDQDEKNPGTQNQGGWGTTDQADGAWGKRVDQDWGWYEQEGATPVNGGDQGWADDDEVNHVDARWHCESWGVDNEEDITCQVDDLWEDNRNNASRDPHNWQNNNCGEARNDNDQGAINDSWATPNNNSWEAQNSNGRGAAHDSRDAPSKTHRNMPSWAAAENWAFPSQKDDANFEDERCRVDLDGNRFVEADETGNQSLQDPVSTVNPGCDASSEVNRDGTRSRPGLWEGW